MGVLVDLDVVGVDGGDVNRAGTKSMRRLRSSSWSMREMPSRTPRSCSLASSTGLSPLPPEASCSCGSVELKTQETKILFDLGLHPCQQQKWKNNDLELIFGIYFTHL